VTNTTKQMTDRELDAWVAENIMGWELLPFNHYHSRNRYNFDDPPKEWFPKGDTISTPYSEKNGPMGEKAFAPTQDLNACNEAEMKLYQMPAKEVHPAGYRPWRVYVEHFADQTEGIYTNEYEPSWEAFGLWKLMTATARQRCEAMRKAMQ